MSELFRNHAFSSIVKKYKGLPIYETYEFDFYRCLAFSNDFYGKTVSVLHSGNLRENKPENRYSKLFLGQKTSYWSDHPETAVAEVKKHGSGNNLLTFWAYDDATSTFPTIEPREPLIIIDGRKLGFRTIIDKIENDIELSDQEKEIQNNVLGTKPDCMAYESYAIKGGVNFLFFEKGFQKLAIREVNLYLSDSIDKKSCIACAITCDYSPFIKSYGEYFMPNAEIGYDEHYIESNEYKLRSQVLAEYRRCRETIK